MSHRNSPLATLVLGALLFVARSAVGQTLAEPSTTPTNRPAFCASLRGGETVGDHQVQRVFLNAGTNEFAFLVPAGFCMNASDPEKIVLSNEPEGCFITVRIHQLSLTDAASRESYFKSTVLSQFPDAKIIEEFSDVAADHTGTAFILQWNSTAETSQSARSSFIPCPAGVLEFTALAPTAHFKQAQMYMTILMTSLRSNETGKLVIVPLPDFS